MPAAEYVLLLVRNFTTIIRSDRRNLKKQGVGVLSKTQDGMGSGPWYILGSEWMSRGSRICFVRGYCLPHDDSSGYRSWYLSHSAGLLAGRIPYTKFCTKNA